jgi:hypothetical protein
MFVPKYPEELRLEIISKVDELVAKGKSVREACRILQQSKIVPNDPYPAYNYWDRKRRGLTKSVGEAAGILDAGASDGAIEEVVMLTGSPDRLRPILTLASELGIRVIVHSQKPRHGA